jgi:hypothetical protein
MQFVSERAAERARRIVLSFRPRPSAHPRVVLTGFASFPGVPRNATADMIRAVAASSGVELLPRSFRAPELVSGAGMVQLPSGRTVRASLMVLPVMWEASAALVAKEARAARASLVVMSGVAAPAQPIFVEMIATGAHKSTVDAFGLRPRRAAAPGRELPLTLDASLAESAAEDAWSRECALVPRLADVIHGARRRAARAENAYVCNATAYGVAALSRRNVRMLGTGARPSGVEVVRTFCRAQGFLHWPRATLAEDAPACARILLAVVDALIAQ